VAQLDFSTTCQWVFLANRLEINGNCGSTPDGGIDFPRRKSCRNLIHAGHCVSGRVLGHLSPTDFFITWKGDVEYDGAANAHSTNLATVASRTRPQKEMTNSKRWCSANFRRSPCVLVCQRSSHQQCQGFPSGGRSLQRGLMKLSL
jgi:hypothetical protein